MNHEDTVKALATEILATMHKTIVDKINPQATVADTCSALLLAAASTMLDPDNLPKTPAVLRMVGYAAVQAGHNEVGMLIGSIVAAFQDLHEQMAKESPAKAAAYN